ncbi:hypothetical protein [Ketogulonicigenium vulgare]|uniref:Uncharacterized protein n=1 Tax=Ketogulonicigenium vulgare (strain WSH-001) TaxID=759362 RepID=F9YAI1_KETVW|nr:hypothetical protein [Ketogulonicigenium vulgare]ADO43218.1 hypothetical protein EIO_2114 [Ketogulonicigenium vulgare Y25]AEM41512.1 hypothetical protein KVU_1673 [Ketogulonicigenium vulgare WSH-001]ALJ81637.1 glyceraldehyde-3-phosphate dehydrogenase [Ketogulonicigenium vulgare]ANW35144.1 hypothetical protein KvSKV_10845 [Ketogulonicigenium vulgare]AOZ55254.1 hypothetical protein KVC_2249 [Ketogulonicigenium vulgare]
MTNQIALTFALLLLLLVGADMLFNHGAALLFLARKFLDLLNWIQFWR